MAPSGRTFINFFNLSDESGVGWMFDRAGSYS